MEKLAVAAALGFVGAITLPLLLAGLAAYALLLGALVELIRNLHDRKPWPLPRWNDLDAKLRRGGAVLTALLVYNLPNLLLGCCAALTSSFWGDGVLGNLLLATTLCCALPLLLAYNLLTWPMLALGLARYADEGNIVVFFQFGDLFAALRRRPGLTLQWLAVMVGVSLFFGLVFAIPCIGWIAAPPLALPVIGYLTAQYAVQIEGYQPGR